MPAVRLEMLYPLDVLRGIRRENKLTSAHRRSAVLIQLSDGNGTPPLHSRLGSGVYFACSGRILSERSGTGDKMSLTNPSYDGQPVAAPISRITTKVTMPALAGMKREGKPITALTAYDYATSRLVDEAGIDMILVGDSLAMVVLGHDNTLAVTVGEMLHHTRAVRRAVRRALVVADMPFGSYHGKISEA
jgi:hypothetical protein